MMEFRRILSEDDALFKRALELYEISFPHHEKRLLKDHCAALADQAYHCEAVLVDREFVGILFYWEGETCCYIEHFAIFPEQRGKAFGSRILEEFCQAHRLIVLEIDPPVDEISVRRERFYQQLGFQKNEHSHIHPAYQKKYPPHRLVLMSYPRILSEGEYAGFCRDLENKVMKYAE